MENKIIEMEAYDVDGVEYICMKKIEHNVEVYLYLSNSDDLEDIMLRKIDKEDPDYIMPLKDEKEVLEVIQLFNNEMFGEEKEN